MLDLPVTKVTQRLIGNAGHLNGINYFYVFIMIYLFPHYNTLQKSTVCLRQQWAKAYRCGRSYTKSVVKPVIIKLQQY